MSEQWLEDLKKKLAKHEGSSGRKKAIEGGGSTRGFGITSISDGLKSFLGAKGLNAEEMSDRDLFNEYVDYEAQRAEKDYPNWNQMPDPLKAIIVDMYYNAGGTSRMPSFNKAIKNNDWAKAGDETLDVVSANDPKTNQSAVLRGLANRRVEFYNELAKDIGKPVIDDFTITPSEIEGKKTTITYSTADGPKVYNFPGSLHSASGSYDDSKKKSDLDYQRAKQYGIQEAMIFGDQDEDLGTAPTAPREPQTTETIVSRETQPPIPPLEVPEEVDPLSLGIDADINQIQDSITVDSNSTFAVNDESLRPPVVVEQPESPYKDFREGTIRYGDIYDPREQADYHDYSMFTPSFSDQVASAFRQYNSIYSLGRLFESQDPRYRPVEGYSVYNDPIAKKLVGEEGLLFYDSSHSHEHFMLRFRRRQQDLGDMKVLDQGDSGGALSLTAALAGPSIFAPLAPMRIMKAGKLRRFLGGTAFTYAATGPQQILIESQNEARDATNTAMAVTAASLIGGALTLAFGKGLTAAEINRINQEAITNRRQMYAALGLTQDAGAAVAPDVARARLFAQLEQEGLEETGVGLERIPANPVVRIMSSPNPAVRPVAASIVDIGGMMPKKIRSAEEATEQSVEKKFQVNFLPTLLNASRDVDKAYLTYRNIVASRSDIGLAGQMMALRVKDIFKRNDGTLTIVQFRSRVGMAMRRNDTDFIDDLATPYVNQAARSSRKVFDKIKSEANSVRLFELPILDDIARAERAGDNAAVAELTRALERLRANGGPFVSNADSYLTRIPRIDKIMANPQRFVDVIRRELMAQDRAMSSTVATRIANEVLDLWTHSKPYVDFEGVGSDAFDWLKLPSGAMARTLNIRDEVLEEFLENDIEVIMKHHTKTMGIDIELTRRFGSPDMKSVIDDVTEEYRRMLDDTVNPEDRALLSKQMEADLRDIRALRDRVRGTYGASKDPHALQSRFIRVMKSVNVLAGMGSAMISSVPDIARIAMVEGFKNTYYKGFAAMFEKQAAIVKRMGKKELNQAAVAIDAVLGLRAHAMADVGDIFGSRYALERSLNEATGMFFVMNGLNLWNQTIKEIAGNVTMLRMTSNIMDRRGWEGLSQLDKERLLKNGINQSDYNIMRAEIQRHGRQINGEWLPQTERWTNPTQRLKFRIALNQNVDRIIITPGAGDRALWTSTELGSMLTQFKSYGQGAHVRMLVAGMQEKDGAFWSGAFLIVGLAAIINEVKREQYGISSNETPDQKLMNAIDRSGLLGWFMDVNNSIEKLSDYGIGMRPALTEQAQYPVHSNAKFSSVLGPTAGFTLNATSVLGDILNDNVTAQTRKDFRFMMPTGNLWWADPLHDFAFGEGKPSNVNRQ